MAQQEHETYYVPEQSKLPLFASLGLFLTVMGLGNWLIETSAGETGSGQTVFLCGLALFSFVLWTWFAQVIKENAAGMNSAQLKRSYVWGMGWFIFSEFMFFAAFFGALYYIRNLALPWLSEGPTAEYLWNGFKAEWPLMVTPDMAANGAAAAVTGPDQNMSNPGIAKWGAWLPFWNTVLLLSSSITVHMAHVALKKGNSGRSFNLWLAATVALGFLFLVLQAEEYIHAYHAMGLTLDSGVYGTTFFMLTGFHGLHVTLGTFMLLVQLTRSVDAWKWRLLMVGGVFVAFYVAFNVGHFSLTARLMMVGAACAVLIALAALKPNNVFKHDDCFGFEASSWYWHFVDVVWLGLFIFVYILA